MNKFPYLSYNCHFRDIFDVGTHFEIAWQKKLQFFKPGFAVMWILYVEYSISAVGHIYIYSMAGIIVEAHMGIR